MLRLSVSKICKARVPAATRTIHTTSMDAVKLAEVREAVHTESKEPEPTLHVSKLPLSKICKEIKAVNDRETARARAIGNDMEFRQVHGRVRDTCFSPSFTLDSSIIPKVLATTATAITSTTQTRSMASSAAAPSNSAHARLVAHQPLMQERIKAQVKSGRCAADLDSAFDV